MSELELVRRFPETRTLAHTELADVPTPVDNYEALASEIGIGGLWVKRDDLTGSLYGGNKVRKLEFLLADALDNDRRDVWTVGAIGSHHVLATSLYARQLGICPRALHFPQPVTDHVQEVLRALSTARPQLELVGSKHSLPVKMLQTKVREWLSTADNPYYIPGGGSSPRGVLGYVNAAMELARQIDNGDLPMPDAIFVAAGTCGTLAGLQLGIELAELPTDVIGVRVVDKVLANAMVTANLANKTGQLLADCGVDVPKIRARDIEIIDDQFGDDYGVPTAEGKAAIELVDAFSDIDLDPTYTAKAFAGLMHYNGKTAQRPLRNVLYWHTLSSANLGELTDQACIDTDLPDEYQQFFEHS